MVAERACEVANRSRPAEMTQQQVARRIVAEGDGRFAERGERHAIVDMLLRDGRVGHQIVRGIADARLQRIRAGIDPPQYRRTRQQLEGAAQRKAFIGTIQPLPAGLAVDDRHAQTRIQLFFQLGEALRQAFAAPLAGPRPVAPHQRAAEQ